MSYQHSVRLTQIFLLPICRSLFSFSQKHAQSTTFAKKKKKEVNRAETFSAIMLQFRIQGTFFLVGKYFWFINRIWNNKWEHVSHF